jgi:hypothetical protein
MVRAPRSAAAIALFFVAFPVACSSTTSTSSPDASAADGGAGAETAAVEAAAEVAVDAGPTTITLLDGVRIVSDSSQPNFQKATTTLTLPAGSFANATLVLDLGTTCFPFANWKTDPPPSGQNWPADCDAFDRNFETLLSDPTAPMGTPRLELVRAITPFGGPEHIEEDVTDVLNGLQAMDGATPKTRTFEIDIPTWSDSAGQVSGSKGGWNVSAKLLITSGAAPRNVVGVVPIVDGSFGSTTTFAPTSITLPAGTTSARVDYRVTGHGGGTDSTGECDGPAEEFCKRTHTVTFDGVAEPTFQPYRTDCQSLCQFTTGDPDFPFSGEGYCKENPCGDPDSVKAPRANWCPGHETAPISWTPTQYATPGAHTFEFKVDAIAVGGTWRVTAVAIAYGG